MAATSTTSSQGQGAQSGNRTPPAPSLPGRNPSFRIPMPPSTSSSSSSAAATGPVSPGAGAGSNLSSSYGGAATATSPSAVVPQSPGGGGGSRFGGLNLGFRRNRGQSTSRDLRSSTSSNVFNTNTNNDSGAANPPLPSPSAGSAGQQSSSFPILGMSTSQPELPPSPGAYYDGTGDLMQGAAGGSASNQSGASGGGAGLLSSSIPSGARGYFSRRGFARKMTSGGNRTPTSEVPPPLLRSRSSSQPSLPLQQQQPAQQTGEGSTASFFPPQSSPGLQQPGATANATGTDASSRPSATAVNDTTEANARPATAEDRTAAANSSGNPPPPTTTTSIASARTAPSGHRSQHSTSNAAASSSTSTANATGLPTQHIRLVPHLESTRSLSFEPVSRDVAPTVPLRIGRFTDRNPNQPASSIDQNRVAFKSKVVSRTHAEIWYDPAPTTANNNSSSTTGGWFIRDLKSSSGTFLNHIRLSGAGMESRPFPLRDGDVLQLGVDYQGGTEEIYRCVKMRVEINRAWQRNANSFNTNALRQIRALGNVVDTGGAAGPPATATTKSKKGKKTKGVKKEAAPEDSSSAVAAPSTSGAPASGVTDCCICLFSVTVYQALFIAPCSHIFHFKCIRPLLLLHHPGFSCPLCRTFADLEADVEQDDPLPVAEEEEEDDDDDDDEEESGSEADDARAVLENDRPPVLPEKDDPAEANASRLAGPSRSLGTESALAATRADDNFETLRPGRRSPHIPAVVEDSSEEPLAGTSSASGRRSEEAARSLHTASSKGRTPSASASASPSAAGRRSTEGHRSVSAARAGTPPISTSNLAASRTSEDRGMAFSPPSAGDFEHDIRRTSIYVHGADGHTTSIPVTGRSRPGSVYSMDISTTDNNNHRSSSPAPASPTVATAAATTHSYGSPTAASVAQHALASSTGTNSGNHHGGRAKSVRSLRMSTASNGNLREEAAEQGSQARALQASHDAAVPTPEAIHSAVAAAAAASAEGSSAGRSRREGQMDDSGIDAATTRMNFDDDDEDSDAFEAAGGALTARMDDVRIGEGRGILDDALITNMEDVHQNQLTSESLTSDADRQEPDLAPISARASQGSPSSMFTAPLAPMSGVAADKEQGQQQGGGVREVMEDLGGVSLEDRDGAPAVGDKDKGKARQGRGALLQQENGRAGEEDTDSGSSSLGDRHASANANKLGYAEKERDSTAAQPAL